MDDALGSPVELRRDRLGQRRNLSNVHMRGLLSDTVTPPAPHIRPVPAECGTSWLLDKETIFDSVRNFAPRYAFSLVLALTPGRASEQHGSIAAPEGPRTILG